MGGWVAQQSGGGGCGGVKEARGVESLKSLSLCLYFLAFCYDPVFIVHPICLEKGSFYCASQGPTHTDRISLHTAVLTRKKRTP